MRPDAVGFADIAKQYIACLRRDGLLVLAEKFACSFQHLNGELTFRVMGMHRKNLSGAEIEI